MYVNKTQAFMQQSMNPGNSWGFHQREIHKTGKQLTGIFSVGMGEVQTY